MAGIGKTEWIKRQIENLILSGEYPPGSQLPSEPRLAEMFKAARGTVRLALSEAEREGVIARRSGMGTFVMRQPKQEKIVSFTQQVRDRDQEPGTRLLDTSLVPAGQVEGRTEEAFRLDLERSEAMYFYRIERLRLADERPVARQVIFLSAADFGQELLEGFDFNRSIFELYQQFNRTAAWADEVINARRPTAEEVELLQMQDIAPEERFVYERNRITYDTENLPLEVLQSVDRGDYFKDYRYRLVAG